MLKQSSLITLADYAPPVSLYQRVLTANAGSVNIWDGNLDQVRERVIKEHPELSVDEIHDGELQYRNFLFRCKTVSNKLKIPGKVADLFWHNHILFMAKYFEDCKAYFGHILIHEPCDDDSSCGQGCRCLPIRP